MVEQRPAVGPGAEGLVYVEKCRLAGRLSEAEAACGRILRASPDLPEAVHMLGLIAHQQGKLGEAIEHLQRACRLAPRAALFHANLGEMQRLAGHPRAAVEAARRALAIAPEMPVALGNLGVALCELKQFDDAATAQRRAIAADPGFAAAHCNLGNALHSLRRYDEAIDAYRRAVELVPDYADAWANLGTTLHHSGRLEDAAVVLRRAIALAPQHANAHSGLGIVLLMRGEFGEGWDEYEWRLRSSERKGPRFPERPWQGESLAGKHIYIQAEQGFGDAIQFARYLPLLAARAGAVTVRIHQQLVRLLSASLPGITVLGDRGQPAPYDCDAVLLSLPRLLKTRLETIPADCPYLRDPPQPPRPFDKLIADMPGLKVGLVWAGNPDHANDHRRSIAPDALGPLFAVDGVSFGSLQYGARKAGLERLGHGKAIIADLAAHFEDFADTARAIGALDVVITVDTSVAHLAGALGKPTWVLLPWVSDWRWMRQREDTPWYPTARLFRQAHGADWTEVVAKVASELRAVAGGDASRMMPFLGEGRRRAADAAAIIAAEARTVGAGPRPAELSPGQALMVAAQKRRDGYLAEADELTRKAAAGQPDNAEAAHMLGLVAYQSGKLEEAIAHVRRAVALAPGVAVYHANLGEMCRLTGRLDEAIAAGRRALELDPDNAGTWSNLGIALFDLGEFDQALAQHDRAVALDPVFAQGHSNRGNALLRLRRFAEAEHAYRRACELQPAFAEGWNNLGTCLRELKRPDEAEAVYRKALALSPNNPDTLDNLALAVKDLDRFDEAEELLRRALVMDPDNDRLLVHRASVSIDRNDIALAAADAGRACALNPNNPDAFNLLGRAAFERGELEAALSHYRHALALKHDLADAYNNMGNALKELGRMWEAQDAFVAALRIDPAVPGVYVNLVDSLKITPDSPHLAAMEALAAKPDGLSKTERMHLDYALGKACADIGGYDRSFRHWLAGSAAKRASIVYDEAATFARFDRIERIFTRELIEAKAGGGDPSPTPIFIIGMPRSGTTLVEQVLASHPAVHGAGELRILGDIANTVRGADGAPIAYPDWVAAIDAGSLRDIGAAYLSEVRKLAPDAQRITDKMPSNYYFAGLIRLALPGAKIIHTVRDPVDTCVSCFSKLFTAEQNHTYDLAELGRYYKRYERLMAHWHCVLPPGSLLDVSYEQVVTDLETQARRIIAHCGLPWHDGCLSFHQTDRTVRTASATQVRQPIYTGAVGRWRVYERHLGPLLAALKTS